MNEDFLDNGTPEKIQIKILWLLCKKMKVVCQMVAILFWPQWVNTLQPNICVFVIFQGEFDAGYLYECQFMTEDEKSYLPPAQVHEPVKNIPVKESSDIPVTAIKFRWGYGNRNHWCERLGLKGCDCDIMKMCDCVKSLGD